MAKKPVKNVLKLQIPGGQASPAPPVGPTLGEHGIPIGEFVNRFNAQTSDQQGVLLPVEIIVYEDRSFDLNIKTPPASFLIKRAAGLVTGSPIPHEMKIGVVTRDQVQEIAERKMVDLNTNDKEMAMRQIEGTARSMGILVAEDEEEAEKIRKERLVDVEEAQERAEAAEAAASDEDEEEEEEAVEAAGEGSEV